SRRANATDARVGTIATADRSAAACAAERTLRRKDGATRAVAAGPAGGAALTRHTQGTCRNNGERRFPRCRGNARILWPAVANCTDCGSASGPLGGGGRKQ